MKPHKLFLLIALQSGVTLSAWAQANTYYGTQSAPKGGFYNSNFGYGAGSIPAVQTTLFWVLMPGIPTRPVTVTYFWE